MSHRIKFVGNEMYEYEVYQILDIYDSRLRTKCNPYSFSNHSAIIEARFHSISLLETMSKYHGVGLAANQVGLNYRLFVMGSEGVGYAFFNPEIINVSGETTFEEGCLSAKGLFLPIRRPEVVKLKYQDMNGEFKEQTFTGLSARIVLHEYDHMEGVVYTSKVSPIILERQKRKVKKNLKLLQAQYERMEKERIIAEATQRVYIEKAKELSKDEIDYLTAHPEANLEQAREVLSTQAQTISEIEGAKRAPDYQTSSVSYVVEKKPDENQ